MATESFKDCNFRKSTMEIINQANEILAESDGITMRGLYYQFIGERHGGFPDDWIDEEYNKKHGLAPDTKNTLKNYKRLIGIMAEARLGGLVDWDALEDELREAETWAEYKSIREPIEQAMLGFRLERWKGQPHYVELWVEKNTLAKSMRTIAQEFHVPLMVNRGYSSLSAMYECSKRFLERCNQPESEFFDDSKDVRTPIIIYVGDHDPSGEDMVRDVEDRLVTFGLRDLEVRKACLTMEQVRRHKLPPNPAKPTDSRSINYMDKHGNASWEIEALRPADMLRYVRDAFDDSVVNRKIMAPILAREKEQRKLLEASVDKMLEELGEDEDE